MTVCPPILPIARHICRNEAKNKSDTLHKTIKKFPQKIFAGIFDYI